MSKTFHKKVLSLITAIVMIYSLTIIIPEKSDIIKASAEKLSAQQIVDRANYLYNLKWTSQANFTGYINSSGVVTKTYSKGNSYIFKLFLFDTIIS